MNFWGKLPKPFFVLAPMHEVTDSAFRQIVASYCSPNVFITEFVSADGLCHSFSQEKIIRYYLKFSQKEKPIVAQIWGSNPKTIFKASKIIASLGFDGVDINMGCPDKKVIKSGGGAALILNPKLAQEIILSAKEGASLPVSVKTRIGFDKNVVEEWITSLLEVKPAVISIHGRLKKDSYQVPADWESIKKAAELAKGSGVFIVGNGDIFSISEAKEKSQKYKLDGIMIGRGVLGNPWFFNEEKSSFYNNKEERLKVAIKHSYLFEETFKGVKPFCHVYKHLSAYLSNFFRSKELRLKVMSAKSAKEVEEIIKNFK